MPRKRRYRKKKMTADFSRNRLSLASNLVTSGTGGGVRAVVHFRSMTNCYNRDVDNVDWRSLNNFAKLKDLYDMYRPTSMRLDFVPAFSANEFRPADTPPTQVPQLVISTDFDNVGVGDITNIQNNKRNIYKALDKKWTYILKIPRYQGGSGVPDGWLNTQSETQNLSGVTAMYTTNTVAGPVIPPGTSYGILNVTLHYQMRDRHDNNARSYNGISKNGVPLSGNDFDHIKQSEYDALRAKPDGVDNVYVGPPPIL